MGTESKKKSLLSLSDCVGMAIREARKESGFSQQDLADDSGVSRVHICNVEAGRHDLPISRFFAISQALLISGSQMAERVERHLDGGRRS